ncbi:MAG TPA: hypothetical protein VIV66_21175 [Pyrinomonadaceae bacterium]
MDKFRKTTISSALIVLLCFFLPWIQVSCGAAKDSVSGINLARDGHSMLWLVPVLMVATVLAGFFASGRSKLDFSALLGFASGLISAYLMNRERLRAQDTSGLLEVRPTGWFWLGFAASVIVLASSGIAFLKPPKPH